LKAVEIGRQQGLKLGLFRPITLWPFPSVALKSLSQRVKGFLDVEMNAGQMVEDVRLATNSIVPIEYFGRFGGMIPSPEEVLEAIKKMIK